MTLNRPQALNSLDEEMVDLIQPQLKVRDIVILNQLERINLIGSTLLLNIEMGSFAISERHTVQREWKEFLCRWRCSQ